MTAARKSSDSEAGAELYTTGPAPWWYTVAWYLLGRRGTRWAMKLASAWWWLRRGGRS